MPAYGCLRCLAMRPAAQEGVERAGSAHAAAAWGFLPRLTPPTGLPHRVQVVIECIIDKDDCSVDVLQFGEPGASLHSQVALQRSSMLRNVFARAAARAAWVALLQPALCWQMGQCCPAAGAAAPGCMAYACAPTPVCVTAIYTPLLTHVSAVRLGPRRQDPGLCQQPGAGMSTLCGRMLGALPRPFICESKQCVHGASRAQPRTIHAVCCRGSVPGPVIAGNP